MRSTSIGDMKVGLVLAALALAGCFESSDKDNGDNNNTGIKAQYYVAVGNSLTAGFQSGGLRKDLQDSSYPALLARAMAVEDFQIPHVDTPGLGSQKILGQNTSLLTVDDSGNIVPHILTRKIDDMLLNKGLDRPYNNLGVPGMTTADFLHAHDSTSSQLGNNGYFNVVLRGGLLGNTSMLRQAILLKPTILTMWVGSNDILGGLTAGTVIEGVTVTPVDAYKTMMDMAFDTLLAETSAHIFLANIPSITTVPFVTTIPPVVINPATHQPVLDSANHPIPLLTKETNVTYVLLPAQSALTKGVGVPKALGGTDSALAGDLTLSADEVATANKLTEGYNAYLKKKADDNPTRITLVDVNDLLQKLLNGEVAGLSAKFPTLDPTHSAFSLDGIHPNSKGYREVAKLYLDVINATLGKSYTLK